MGGLSPVAESGGHSSSRCAGLSLSRPLLLRSTGSRCAGSAIVAHEPSCSAACGIFPNQGSNPCPLHWQAESQPLRHQGREAPGIVFLICVLGCSLFVYRNAIDFSVLIFYPTTLQNLIIISNWLFFFFWCGIFRIFYI